MSLGIFIERDIKQNLSWKEMESEKEVREKGEERYLETKGLNVIIKRQLLYNYLMYFVHCMQLDLNPQQQPLHSAEL